jgi:glyoxylase-like metal-dependent hydrolase (beta-lactamase superfamily II)
MKVIQIDPSDTVYSSNAFLVLGSWNTIEDVNTLVDVGDDPAMVDTICTIHTGLGKRKVDRVILTHCHSDHVGNLERVREAFEPEICAFSPHIKGIDRLLKNGEILRLGDQWFEVIHAPCHSDDSIILYNPDEGVLFGGDTPLIIRYPGGTYNEIFKQLLENLTRRDIKTIFFGHGDPLCDDVREILLSSLHNAALTSDEGQPCL